MDNHKLSDIESDLPEENPTLTIQDQNELYTQNGAIGGILGLVIICTIGSCLTFLGWSKTDDECLITDDLSVSWILFGYGLSILSSTIFTIPIFILIDPKRSSGICNTGRRRLTAQILFAPAFISYLGVFMLPLAMSIFFFQLADCAYDQTVFIIVYGIISFVFNPLTITVVTIIVIITYACLVAKD